MNCKTIRKAALSLLLTLCAALAMTPGAGAADAVDYLDAAWNAETKTVDFTEKTCDDYTAVTSGLTAWTDGCWYVVKNNVTISDRVSVTGEVNLILCDGKTLTASKGIQVSDGNALNIYGQSAGTGKLSASGGGAVGYQNYYGAGIGGGNRKNVGKTACGDVTIYGGTVTASGGWHWRRRGRKRDDLRRHGQRHCRTVRRGHWVRRRQSGRNRDDLRRQRDGGVLQ